MQSRDYYRLRYDGAVDPTVWNKIYSKDRQQRSGKRQTLGQSLIFKNASKEKEKVNRRTKVDARTVHKTLRHMPS